MKSLKRIIAIVLALTVGLASAAMEKADSLSLPKAIEYTDEYLDSVSLKKKFIVNDYSLIGVEYGATANMMSFNPPRNSTYFITPNTIGVFYTRYGKMFGYLPYFGFKVGLRYTTEGYKFKENKETGVIADIEGATQAKMDLIEVPMMAHFHIDVLHFKVMADLGVYGGYRMNIERTGPNVDEAIKNSFLDTDRRFDYGLVGGIGFGLVFDPVEFHVNANLRYGWGTLYDPDYYSKYFYRFAYPLNVSVSAGLYFQLTKRTGKSKPQIKREARESVYMPKEQR